MLCDFFMTFYLWTLKYDVNVPVFRICMFLGLPDPHPHPIRWSEVWTMDARIQIRIRIRTKMSRIRNTPSYCCWLPSVAGISAVAVVPSAASVKDVPVVSFAIDPAVSSVIVALLAPSAKSAVLLLTQLLQTPLLLLAVLLLLASLFFWLLYYF